MKIPHDQIVKASPHLFARDVWGLRMTEAHNTMLDHLMAGKRQLLLCMRGIGKSELVRAYVAWYALNNPDKRILIVSDTDQKSQSFLRAIKMNLESEKIKNIFGDVKGEPWTDHTLFFNTRTKIFAEGTIQALGSGSGAVTGRHFDMIVVDDLVSFDSTRSELKRDRTREWFLTSLLPTLMGSGTIISAGTKYHFVDIYSTLINKLNYNTLILPPIKSDGTAQCEFLRPIKDVVNDKGQVVLEGLESIKHNLGSIIYSLQYENDTKLLMSGNIVNYEWIQYWDVVPKLESVIITCDPAISKSDGADYTAIIVGGRADNGNIYIKDYINDHLSFKETIDKIKALVRIHNPNEVRVEQVGFSEAFITELKRKIPATVINGIKPVGDKESRLREVTPIMENMLVYFAVSHGDIVDQLLLFPDGDHDDLVDAIQIFLHYYKTSCDGIVIF